MKDLNEKKLISFDLSDGDKKKVIEHLREKGFALPDQKVNALPADNKQNEPVDNWHPDQSL